MGGGGGGGGGVGRERERGKGPKRCCERTYNSVEFPLLIKLKIEGERRIE